MAAPLEHPALSPTVREYLDRFLLETIAELREMLANEHPAFREGFSRLPPAVCGEWFFCSSIRETLWRYRTALHAQLALVAIEASERAAIDAYVEALLGPVRRSASPEIVLEELWKTLALRIRPEKAQKLGYQAESGQKLDDLTLYVRGIVGREVRMRNYQDGVRRMTVKTPEWGKGTVGEEASEAKLGALDRAITTNQHRAIERGTRADEKSAEETPEPYRERVLFDEEAIVAAAAPDDSPEEALLRAEEKERREAVPQNDSERAYVQLREEGYKPAEAEKLSGLTRGKRRGLDKRLEKAVND